MNYRHFIVAALFGLGLLGAYSSPIFGTTLWTTVGSDGTPDDTNRNYVQYTGATVELKASFYGTVIMRYNIDKADLDGSNVLLKFRYRDNGPGARVIVILKEHNFETGTVTDVSSFDSNEHNQSPDIQEGYFETCTLTSSHPFDFENNAYYIEVKLQRTGSGGKPGLSQIRMYGIIC
jgi:hypothetical protein